MLSFPRIHCPYCGENIEIAVDASADEQDYIEDCRVCCRPIMITVAIDDESGEFTVTARAENDA